MVLEALKSMFGRRIRLPRDQVTRVPRGVRKAVEPQVAAIQAAIDTIAACSRRPAQALRRVSTPAVSSRWA